MRGFLGRAFFFFGPFIKIELCDQYIKFQGRAGGNVSRAQKRHLSTKKRPQGAPRRGADLLKKQKRRLTSGYASECIFLVSCCRGRGLAAARAATQAAAGPSGAGAGGWLRRRQRGRQRERAGGCAGAGGSTSAGADGSGLELGFGGLGFGVGFWGLGFWSSFSGFGPLAWVFGFVLWLLAYPKIEKMLTAP